MLAESTSQKKRRPEDAVECFARESDHGDKLHYPAEAEATSVLFGVTMTLADEPVFFANRPMLMI